MPKTKSSGVDLSKSKESRTSRTCDVCQNSLAGGRLVVPWEEGNNSYGYIVCPHCRHKNIVDGLGEDD